MKKYFFLFFIAFILLTVGKIVISADSTFDEEMLELIESSTSNYGYNYLGTLPDGEKLQEMYREIDTIAKKMMLDYNTTYSKRYITNTIKYYGRVDKTDSFDWFRYYNIGDVFRVYYNDNPYIYVIRSFFGTVQSYKEDGEIVSEYNVGYNVCEEYLLGEERERINKKILGKSKEIKKKTEGYTSKYLITRIIYNEICKGMKYEYNENGNPSGERHAHNIVGFFDNGSGVCETYARTMQFLLRYCGVESVYVEGYANSLHAWNAVKMDDGKWYWFDATWDDAGSAATYEYFCKGNNFFFENHEVRDNPYRIPKTAVDEANVDSFNKLVVDGVEYKFLDRFLIPVKKEEGKEIKDSIKFNGNNYTVSCLHSEKEKIGYDEKCKMCNRVFKHKHDVDFLEEVEATCLKEGLMEGEYCTICGEILFPQETIPKKDHVLGEWVVEWEATYEYEGLRSKKCEVCKSVILEEAIPKLVKDNKDNVSDVENNGCNSASFINAMFLLVPIVFIKRKKHII